eukprot:3090546-Rhodomonas_salina.2
MGMGGDASGKVCARLLSARHCLRPRWSASAHGLCLQAHTVSIAPCTRHVHCVPSSARGAPFHTHTMSPASILSSSPLIPHPSSLIPRPSSFIPPFSPHLLSSSQVQEWTSQEDATVIEQLKVRSPLAKLRTCRAEGTTELGACI